MPLLLPALNGELIAALDKGPKGNPDPTMVGKDIAKAYFNYCSGGTNGAGQPMTAMSGASQLGTDLGDLYAKNPNTGPAHAASFSIRVNDCLMTWMSVYQTSIITAAGTSALHQELNNIYSKSKGVPSLYATALGRALHNFTRAAIVSGIIPDAPGVSFTGPIN